MNDTTVTHTITVERQSMGYTSAPLVDVRRAVNAIVAEAKATGDGDLSDWRVHVLEVQSDSDFRFRSRVVVEAKRRELRR